MRRLPISIRLVAKPGKFDEEIRHEINVLDAKCFPLDRLFNKDDCFWWIVYEGERAIAFAGLRRNPGTDTGFLCRAGVVPGSNRRGLQRKLIEARVRYARRIGLELIETYTAVDNFKSMANLVRVGLHITQIDSEFMHFEMKI